jgi:2-polyprenyl-3-methyl-5-hydroxy-6-metoxy-1,4-benzoquinol methylase
VTTMTRPAGAPAPAGPATQTCALCRSPRSKTFVAAKHRTVVECLDCGLRALSPMPTLDELIGINEETVHPFFNACLEDEESYRAYFARKLDDLQRHHPRGRLLDVGCGAGFFLDAARARGFEVSGVDLSPVPAAFAREQLALDVAVGSLYGYGAPDGAFDVVTIFQTIEHDPDPAALAGELFRMLAPDGVLMVTTPAADGFVARVMGKRWFGYRNVEHVSFFSRKSLRHALEAAGFEIVFLEVEHGKRLTGKYVLNRLINYYYDHRAFLRNGLRLLHPPMLLLGKVPLFEPWAHLYALARKPSSAPRAGVPPYLSSANGHTPASD